MPDYAYTVYAVIMHTHTPPLGKTEIILGHCDVGNI